MGRGDQTGVNLAALAASRRAEARRKRLAMAPKDVNASRWLAIRQGRTLSVDRVFREVRRALRRLDGREREAAKVALDRYEAAVSLALQPTLDTIASIQESRRAKRARTRRRRSTEGTLWPTYWTYPEPLAGSGIRPVDDLEGAARRAFDNFSVADAKQQGIHDQCFADYDAIWREEEGGEDRAMPLVRASQANGACRVAAWYDYVQQAPWGDLPLGVYTDAMAEEVRAVLAGEPSGVDDGGEGGVTYDPDAGGEDIPF